MHKSIKNLIEINKEIKTKIFELDYKNYNPQIIAVSKTFSIDYISHIINYGHIHFGENKVQEALEKWSKIKKQNNSIKLHMLGRLQTNKVKHAVKIFDFIHSVDNEKLAKKISEEQNKISLKPKIFIQVNIGNEVQKTGIDIKDFFNFFNYCLSLNLNVIGTMCIPPLGESSNIFFSRMLKLNIEHNIRELSMGMSSDYKEALKFKATYLRIGSKIFGQRT
jgi:pyridoxal phosphate enzyme, YggS family